MNTTIIRTLREIAKCYDQAAEALEHAAWLTSTLSPDPDRAARVDAMVADLDRETASMPVDSASDDPDAQAQMRGADCTYADAIAALGWDPDKCNTRDARDNVYALRTIEDLDRVEALEKRRAEMRPQRKVRDSVLEAITARRDVLAARAPRGAAP